MSINSPLKFSGHIPHTPIILDNFNVHNEKSLTGNLLFFLSHYHADHTIGLNPLFNRGKIYCTRITRQLLLHDYPQMYRNVIALPYNQPTIILTPSLQQQRQIEKNNSKYLQTDESSTTTSHTLYDSKSIDNHEDNASSSYDHNMKRQRYDTYGMDSITVTAIDANHCPGSCMFIFQSVWGKIIYTGDFRYDTQIYGNNNNDDNDISLSSQNATQNSHPLFLYGSNADMLIFDATFAHPSCDFPCKSVAIQSIIQLVKNFIDSDNKDKEKRSDNVNDNNNDICTHRIYLACDGLGSEELLIALHDTFHSSIYINTSSTLSQRYNELRLLDDTRNIVINNSAHHTLFHLCENQNFVDWAKADQQRRIQLQSQYHDQLPLSEPKNVLYLKPSTMWFVKSNINVMENSRDDNDTVASTSVAWNNDRCNPVVVDKFNVHHVLYSMHSDLYEIMDMIRTLKPKHIIPMNTPCRLDEACRVNRKHHPLSRHHLNSALTNHSTIQKQFAGFSGVDTFLQNMHMRMQTSSHINTLTSASLYSFTEADVINHLKQHFSQWIPHEYKTMSIASPNDLNELIKNSYDSHNMSNTANQSSPLRMQSHHPSVYAKLALKNRLESRQPNVMRSSSIITDNSISNTSTSISRSKSSPVKNESNTSAMNTHSSMYVQTQLLDMGASSVKRSYAATTSGYSSSTQLFKKGCNDTTADRTSHDSDSNKHVHTHSRDGYFDFSTIETASIWLASDLKTNDRQTLVASLRQLNANIRYEWPLVSPSTATSSQSQPQLEPSSSLDTTNSSITLQEPLLILASDMRQQNTQHVVNKLIKRITSYVTRTRSDTSCNSTDSQSHAHVLAHVAIYSKQVIYDVLEHRRKQHQQNLSLSSKSNTLSHTAIGSSNGKLPSYAEHCIWHTGMINDQAVDGISASIYSTVDSANATQLPALENITPSSSPVKRTNAMNMKATLVSQHMPLNKRSKTDTASTSTLLQSKLKRSQTEIIVID